MPKGAKIKLYRATTAGALPPAGSLEDGELALDALSDPPHLWTQVPTTRDPSGRIDLLGDGVQLLTISSMAPSPAGVGMLWFDSAGLQTYLRYDDGDSIQWVPVNNQQGGVGLFAPLTNPAGGQNNYASLASPNFSGTVSIGGTALSDLFAPLTNPVGGQNNYLPINNPTFTGTLTGPAYLSSGTGPIVAFGSDLTSGAQVQLTGATGVLNINVGNYYSGGWVPNLTQVAGIGLFAFVPGEPEIAFYLNNGLTLGQTYVPAPVMYLHRVGASNTLTLQGAFYCHSATVTELNVSIGNITAHQGSLYALYDVTAGRYITANLDISSAANINATGLVTCDQIVFATLGNGWPYAIRWDGAGLYIYVGAGPMQLTLASDRRLKSNIEPTQVDALAAIRAIPLHAYDMPVTQAHFDCGFIAQDLEEQIPNSVQCVTIGKDDTRMPQWQPLVAYLMRAMQQLANRVDELGNQVVALEGAR